MKLQQPYSVHRQRGAIMIMTAAFMLAAISLLALAIDTGRLYAAQTRLQSTANIAALDAARQLSGCSAEKSAAGVRHDIADAITAAVTANQSGANIKSSFTPGNYTTRNNYRRFTPDFAQEDSREADTVRVSLSQKAPNSLLRAMFGGNSSQRIRATAAATQKPIGALSIASNLAQVDTEKSKLLNGLLGGLLGTKIDLNVLDYRDLAQANITLAGLVKTSTQVGNVDDLLGLALRPGDLLKLIGKASGIKDTPLETIGSSLDSSDTIELGNLLNLEAGTRQVAAQIPINVLGLVMALAQTSAADRGDVISLGPDLLDGLLNGVSNLLPGVKLGLGLQLGIVEPPQFSGIGRAGFDDPDKGRNTSATGSIPTGPGKAPAAFAGARTWASTSQINLNLDATAHIKILGLILNLDVPLYVSVAKSYSILDQISCASYGNQNLAVKTTTSPGILELGIGHFDDTRVPNPQTSIDPNAKLLDLKIRKLLSGGYHDILGLKLPANGITASTASVSNVPSQTFNGPFVPQIASPSEDNTQPVSAHAVEGLGNLLGQVLTGLTQYVVNSDPFTGLLGGLLNIVTDVLQALHLDGLLDLVGHLLTSLTSGLDKVLDPLLGALGVSVGNAYVTINAVVPQQPVLICASSGKPELGDCKSITASQ